jgi:hypothetical protein
MLRVAPRFDRPYAVSPSVIQPLHFTIRLAEGAEDLERIAEQRAQAYSRHQPDLVERMSLSKPEKDDFREDAVVIVAESKESGDVLGSMRLTTNIHKPLRFETEFDLPERFHDRVLLEAGRMTACSGSEGRMVVPALLKTAFEASFYAGVDYLLLIARRPIDRMYRSLGFKDLFDGRLVVTSAQPGVPVTLFHTDIAGSEAILQNTSQQYYSFFAETDHPDILIDHKEVFIRFTTYKRYEIDLRPMTQQVE